ncbi:Fanconi anemia group J protein homolog isoform X1 [Vespa crabro]|uniref:Fanconi anemia group J protein homolog isoform X1 n=2 Tax=Vespa crabro TaxID=7445 RepID=UPI001F02227E|nr:Fanconi anemia group J protein homolog isoform X1 [Vespa crabro]
MHVFLIIIAIIVTLLYHLIKFYIEDWFYYDIEMDSSKSKNDKERFHIDIFEISSDESSIEGEKIKNPLSLRNNLKHSTVKKSINVDLNPNDSNKKKTPIVLDISIESDSNDSDNLNQLSALQQQQSSVKETTSTDVNSESNNEKAKPDVFDISTDTDSNISDDFTQASCVSHATRMGLFPWKKQKRLSSDSQNGNNDKSKDMSTAFDNSVPISVIKESKIRKVSERQRFTKNEETPIKYFNNPSPPIISDMVEMKELQTTDVMQDELVIAGSKVKFPVQPYPCQLAVMNRLIESCTKENHCLLESPTGSGKTLALLCGVLGWQDTYSKIIKSNLDRRNDKCLAIEEDDDCTVIEPTSSQASLDGSKKRSENMINLDDILNENKEKTRLKIPKIYYGTRTHRQIEQVVKELGRTDYRNKKMTILSSREHTCLHNTTKNKTEFCYNLLDPESFGCIYYTEKNKKDLSTFSQLEKNGITMPFDIEDLVEVGRKNQVCPYFAAKNLVAEAEIIICPYNYIIDPDIRESMQINLKDQVIIFDEAHNIEDICRNVASADFREDELRSVLEDCKVLKSKESIEQHDAYSTIISYIESLINCMNTVTLKPTDKNDEMNSSYWTGKQLIELFKMFNIDMSKCIKIIDAAQIAISEFNKIKENLRVVKHDKLNKFKTIISRSTKIILQRLIFALKMIISDEYANDYRAYINESFVSDIKFKITDNSWTSSQRTGKRLRSFKLICMNSAVIFAPLAREARSIILASGTLTPITSFQSELGTKFAHTLSANHVINSDQVYITCVPKGPTGISLKANYQNVNSWNFQDELGKLLLIICQSIPHGILCFFSSYYMMNNQIKRWKSNNYWEEIKRYKRIFIEPRNSNDLGEIMKEYREAIEETSYINTNIETLSGAILFAVFRGKIAEGTDFSDNEARCVLTIGIPYAVRTDPEVNLKWMYNDENSSKELLTGSEWYTVQAFRALNQAIGRCIRHRNDWGIVLLVDERFQAPSNINYLPKWVKKMWRRNPGINLIKELESFVMKRKTQKEEEEAEEEEDT